MKNPYSNINPSLNDTSAPLCNLNCNANRLREIIHYHLQCLTLIAEGIVLTRYTDDEFIPENLKSEGIAQREHYCKMLFKTIREIHLEISEVKHVPN